MIKEQGLVYGWGINDADYVVHPTINGKLVVCRFYRTWANMIRRCRSGVQPTYAQCSVCDDWRYFSNFKSWMQQQDYHGKQLDKDLITKGNKIYSPNTCIFIESKLNNFITDSRAKRGYYPLGVYLDKINNGFIASCSNGKGDSTYLGYFKTPEEAHEAWRSYKHKLACQYADEQTDPRIAHALRTRYSYEEWYKDKDDKQ